MLLYLSGKSIFSKLKTLASLQLIIYKIGLIFFENLTEWERTGF